MASWYEKNIIAKTGFSGESDGSPLVTLLFGVAIGGVAVYAYQNRAMLKRHIMAPGLHPPPTGIRGVYATGSEIDERLNDDRPTRWPSTIPPPTGIRGVYATGSEIDERLNDDRPTLPDWGPMSVQSSKWRSTTPPRNKAVLHEIGENGPTGRWMYENEA